MLLYLALLQVMLGVLQMLCKLVHVDVKYSHLLNNSVSGEDLKGSAWEQMSFCGHNYPIPSTQLPY